MVNKTCQFGEDCDLTVAWMAGRESAKDEAKARIEELEDKLAKALEALEWAEFHLDDVNVTSCTVSTAIAELKGATND